MLNRIDPTKLYRLSVVVREGGFSRASEKLCISQSALSQSITQLEKELGIRLLDRISRGVVPTKFGLSLLHYADAIQYQLEQASEHIEQLKFGTRRALSIGCSGASMTLVSRTIHRLQGRASDLVINLTEEINSHALVDRLIGREVDCALLPEVDYRSSEVSSFTAFASHRVIVVRQGHPITQSEDFCIADLLKYQLAFPSTDSSTAAAVQSIFDQLQLNIPKSNVIRSNSLLSAKEIILNTNAFALMSEISIDPLFSRGDVVCYPIGDITKYWFGFYTRAEQTLSSEIQDFIAELTTVCKERAVETHPAIQTTNGRASAMNANMRRSDRLSARLRP